MAIQKLLHKISLVFADEKLPVTKRKLQVAEAILRIRNARKRRFGLFVIFGWKNRWNDLYVDVPDITQDIFARHGRNIFHAESIKEMASTVAFDGAILIDSSGAILHSGIIIEGLRPRKLAAKVSTVSHDKDMSTRLGFKTKVHARHLSAIAASWELKGTTVYTVSEETGDMHIFENGRIIFSTVRGEV